MARPWRVYEFVNCGGHGRCEPRAIPGHQFMLQSTLWGAGQAGVSPSTTPCLRPQAHLRWLLDTSGSAQRSTTLAVVSPSERGRRDPSSRSRLTSSKPGTTLSRSQRRCELTGSHTQPARRPGRDSTFQMNPGSDRFSRLHRGHPGLSATALPLPSRAASSERCPCFGPGSQILAQLCSAAPAASHCPSRALSPVHVAIEKMCPCGMKATFQG